MANQKISWKIHFIELIVVIIGISIAFALEGYTESKKEKKVEVNYLNSLKIDLQKDKEDLQAIMDSTNNILKDVGEIFYFNYQNLPLSSYKRHHITSTYLATYFYPKNGTYVSLVNSGDLNVIKDFGLKTTLSDLYSVDYSALERLDNVVKNLADNLIQPYMIENVAFLLTQNQDGIKDAAPLKTNQATNLMGSYYNLLGGRQQAYKGVMAKCDSLIGLLDKELILKK